MRMPPNGFPTVITAFLLVCCCITSGCFYYRKATVYNSHNHHRRFDKYVSWLQDTGRYVIVHHDGYLWHLDSISTHAATLHSDSAVVSGRISVVADPYRHYMRKIKKRNSTSYPIEDAKYAVSQTHVNADSVMTHGERGISLPLSSVTSIETYKNDYVAPVLPVLKVVGIVAIVIVILIASAWSGCWDVNIAEWLWPTCPDCVEYRRERRQERRKERSEERRHHHRKHDSNDGSGEAHP